MKTKFCVLAAMLAMGFWWSAPSYLSNARSELSVDLKPLTKAPLNSNPGTKVAIVNIPTVIEKYSKAIQFRQNIEDKIFPFKEKAKKIHDAMESAKVGLRSGKSSSDEAKRLESRLRDYQSDLEKLEGEIKVFLASPWMKENDELIWQDINRGIDAIAKAYGFQIVFGHGISKTTVELSAYRFPVMRAIDHGAAPALYVDRSIDITEAVISTIQPRWRPYVK